MVFGNVQLNAFTLRENLSSAENNNTSISLCHSIINNNNIILDFPVIKIIPYVVDI